MNALPPVKVVHLVSGAGGMYCGSCLHGSSLAKALFEAGHDVMLVPLYTPIRTDEEAVPQQQLAFGGLNVFLQQKLALFRKMPAFVDRFLDRPGLVRWMSRFGGKTDASQLGALTVSMLRGRAGHQGKEVDKLLELLAGLPKFDVLHLSNVLLAGVAEPIRTHLGVPVVAGLTGEDIFLENLTEPHASEAQAELRRCIAHIDGLVATNSYFAARMAEYLAVSEHSIHVIPPGIRLEGHGVDPGSQGSPCSEGVSDGMRIGYFSRICHDKGLHLLAEALEIVARKQPDLRFTLEAAGYLGPDDRQYLRQVQRRFKSGHLRGRFRYAGSPDRAGKIAFLRSVDVVCLPSVFPESKGIVALEAWANARPLIAPASGAFPELVADTGGGLLFESGNAESLARSILELAHDRERAAEMGRLGQEAVQDRYHDGLLAERTAALYHALLTGIERESG